MKEYIVKVKDLNQNITHTVRQRANNKTEANSLVLKQLTKLLRTIELEIK